MKGKAKNHMGKMIIFAALFAVVLSVFNPTPVEASGNTKVTVMVFGEALTLDGVQVFGQIRDSRTFVPLRALSEAFGLEVSFDAQSFSACIGEPPVDFGSPRTENGNNVIKIFVDGVQIFATDDSGIEVFPFVEDGRTLMPLRAVSEILGCSVDWDGATSTATISGGSEGSTPVTETPKDIIEEAKPQTSAASKNIDRDYEWYFDQGTTGNDGDCGPSVAIMSAKWVDQTFSKSANQLRDEFTPGSTDWWYTSNIEDFFKKYGINYERKNGVTGERLKTELDNGNIIVMCHNTAYLTENDDEGSHYGRFYNYADGHFSIVKGYQVGSDGKLYFQVYDPNSWGDAYADGTLKGKDRYYLGTEVVDSAKNWWDSFLVVKNPKNYQTSQAPASFIGNEPVNILDSAA